MIEFFIIFSIFSIGAYSAPNFVSSEFSFNGVRWKTYLDEASKRIFFLNSNTGKSQWGDPRAKSLSRVQKLSTMFSLFLPFLIVALCVYLFYYIYREKIEGSMKKLKVHQKGKRPRSQ
mmetsp:Transcript_2145/g.3233  ORF Transcript_2145/g.3233 Transcript_2145/m.3233 type:complete len:118 (-) Transcript_2145:91-444(-)